MKKFNCLKWFRLWLLFGTLSLIMFHLGNSAHAEDTITANTKSNLSVEDYRHHGICVTPPPSQEALLAFGDQDDCSRTQSKNLSSYDPTEVYQIPVWVHIITNDDGTKGKITNAEVVSQIQVLNEDFRALAGSPGAYGTDVMVQFYLARVDRIANNEWYGSCLYQDCNNECGGGTFDPDETFKDELNKDPNHYLNIYTKTWKDAPGIMGYATAPWDSAGKPNDGVVINWRHFGRNSSAGPPYDQGRTTTHEVGHYLGLKHTFQDGCVSAAEDKCNSNGDLICDTNPQAAFNRGCPNPAPTSCPNVIVNGSFENPLVSCGNWDVFPSIDGWQRSFGPNIEIINHWQGWNAYDGNQLLELDSHGSTGIYQDITTTPGLQYVLHFAFSPRPGYNINQNVLRVLWGGIELTKLQKDGGGLNNTSWKWYTYTVTATTTKTRLEFQDIGISDKEGTLIDAVSLTPEPFLEDPIHNYMNYTDHTCMEEFTEEQAQRIICTLENYRPQLTNTNLLVNGSFENGLNPPTGSFRVLQAVNNDIDDWTVSSGQVDWIYAHWTASDGNYSIDLSGYIAGKIEQTFPTEVNQQYVVTFDMAGNYMGGDPIKKLEIMAAGQSKIFSFDASSSSSGNMRWRKKWWFFSANDINTTLSFRSIANYASYGPVIDNVRVEVLPHPKKCNHISPEDPINAGYGSPYNVLYDPNELLVDVLCASSSVTVEVGSGKSNQLIWRQGYILNRDAWAWEPYDLAGDNLQYENWYVGNANATISVPPAEIQDDNNYILAYICTWTGTEWKCGCRDHECGTRYWQLQRFGQASATSYLMTGISEGGVAEDQTSSLLPPPPPPPGYKPDIVVIEPNGGETIPSGSIYTIDWDAPEKASTFSLAYSWEKGKKWQKIDTGITEIGYDWTVPTPNKNLMNCLVKVTAFDSAGKKLGGDVSDAPFAIEVLTLTTPNGGEAIAAGSSYDVSWDTYDTQNPVDHVKIFCSTSGGKKKKKKKWKLMATEPGDPGISTCEFPVPKKNMTNCLIKAVAYDYTGAKVAEDQSDSPFSIEVISVISPNGGETLYGGDVVSIDWQTHQTIKEVAKVVLKYSFKGGKKWKTIETITGDNPGTYPWTVPAVLVAKNKCKVMVQLKDTKGKSIGSDTSDSYFTIQP